MKTACPSCRNPMQQRHLDAKYGGKVTVDACFACHGIWFDGNESLQLAPGGVLRLFWMIYEQGNAPRRALDAVTHCPRCSTALVKTHDVQRNTRFMYLRCPSDHGRLSTFFQFLREKDFVRTVDAAQLAELRRHVKVLKCSHCGAPVNLEKTMACDHCGAAISALDPGAVESALRELQRQEVARTNVDPTLPLQLLRDATRSGDAYSRLEAISRASGEGPGWRATVDLVDLGIDAVMSLLRR